MREIINLIPRYRSSEWLDIYMYVGFFPGVGYTWHCNNVGQLKLGQVQSLVLGGHHIGVSALPFITICRRHGTEYLTDLSASFDSST